MWELSTMLSARLNKRITIKKLVYLANNKKYREFYIKKRDGRDRVIDAPEKDLIEIQRIILKEILYKKRFAHPSCHGFVRKKSIITNARKHTDKNILWKVDIKDFFPSITKKRILALFLYLGFSQDLSNMLSELVTYKDRLPQGAPTSPYLSNLVCKKMDVRLYRYAKIVNLYYSRYADDIIFSGITISGSIMNQIKTIINNEGFEINEQKTRLMGKGSRQVACGLIVNKNVDLGRKKILNIRAIIFRCERRGIWNEIMSNTNIHKRYYHLEHFKYHLLGKIALLKNTNPDKWLKLKSRIDKLDWDNLGLSRRVFEAMGVINKVTSTTVFRYDLNVTKPFTSKCSSIDELNSRVSEIYYLIDKIDTQYFENNSNNARIAKQNEYGSVKIVQEYLKDNNKNLEGNDVIAVWNDIKILADHIVRHPSEKNWNKVDKVFNKYGLDASAPNYEYLRYILFENFRTSLEELSEIITIPKS